MTSPNDWWEQVKERQRWLENLKEGDEVGINRSGYLNLVTFATVVRTTKTLIVVGKLPGIAEDYVLEFRRKDGTSRVPHDRNLLTEPTEKLKKELAEAKLRREVLAKFRNISWDVFPTEALKQILNICADNIDK